MTEIELQKTMASKVSSWFSTLRNRLTPRARTDSASHLVDCPRNPANSSPASTASTTVSSDYTELMSGSVPCPSCGGSGRIPKELEETLVALIPMSDDRLKPKKTVLYVFLGILACIFVTAILVFIFLPRSVILTAGNAPIEVVHVYDRDNETHSFIGFHFMNGVNVTNSNYFPVDIVNVSATIISKFQPWSKGVVGTGYNHSSLRILPFEGSTQRIWFNNTVSLTDIAAEYCQAPYSRLTSLYVSLQFDIAVTLKYFYYDHQEQITISTHQQACCIPSGNCTMT